MNDTNIDTVTPYLLYINRTNYTDYSERLKKVAQNNQHTNKIEVTLKLP
jgi:hypothetical protein